MNLIIVNYHLFENLLLVIASPSLFFSDVVVNHEFPQKKHGDKMSFTQEIFEMM